MAAETAGPRDAESAGSPPGDARLEDQTRQPTAEAVAAQLVQHMGGVVKGLHAIARAIEQNAQATELLARATAGEFDQDDQPQDEQFLSGRSNG